MSFLTPVRNYVDGLVHPLAQQDALTAARHRAFIAPRLLGSAIVLASFPLYIVVRGALSAPEVAVFAWLVAAPILMTCFLSRTGRYETAYVLSSLSLAGLAVFVALYTGGIRSFAAIWLMLVPLEAALSASRRVIIAAAIVALGAAGLLLVLGGAGTLSETAPTAEEQGALAALSIVLAMLYATSLALRGDSLGRASVSLLHAEEDRFRLLAHNMVDVIIRHGRNGSVLFISPAAESLFGAPVNELMGHGLFDRVHVADRPAYLAALADAASLNEERLLEFRVRRGDAARHAGQFNWVEMRCRPLNSGDREVVSVVHDISERKSHERALEAARSESDRASSTKSRFVATVSHELRTPLNAIIGFSEMLANDSIEMDRERRLDYAKLINESGRHLLSVVNSILDVSKMDAGGFEIMPESFAPAVAIESCCDLLALKAQEAGVELRTRVAAKLQELVADRRAFNQILINLISNAIKFTPRDGRVTVGASCDGPIFALTVEDTGVGIGEADLPQLGEAFFQVRASYDRRHDGSGLGLSIVKGLVHLHGGDVEIQSRLGTGTCVTVRLPLHCEHKRTVTDPVKFPGERSRGLARPANERVKKSA